MDSRTIATVTMTDFSTHCYKSGLLRRMLRWALLWALLACASVHAQVATEISQMRVERSEDEWQLSAQIQFELPTAVEDALLKGIPMVFVASADVLKERWYWTDKKLTSAERHMRLAYQPLTRHWRLNISSGPAINSGVGLALNQSYDTLAQALSAIKRLSKWKFADAVELDAAGKYKLDFRFRLDLGQLPRPFQIGALGQTDWDIAVSTLTPLIAEPGK
jgi:hypothetical protein